MPRENELVQALDESFNTRLEKALAVEQSFSLGNSSRHSSILYHSRNEEPLPLPLSRNELPRPPTSDSTDGYLSDDDKFQQLLDKKLEEEQEKLERQGIPAINGVPLNSVTSLNSSLNVATTTAAVASSQSSKQKPKELPKPLPKPLRKRTFLIEDSNKENVCDHPTVASPTVVIDKPSMTMPTAIVMKTSATGVTESVTAVAKLATEETVEMQSSLFVQPVASYSAPATTGSSVAPAVVDVAPTSNLPDIDNGVRISPSKTLDANGKQLKTPRKAGGGIGKKMTGAGTPLVGAKSDATSLLGRVGFSANGNMVSSMDPRHLKENNRRLAQEYNKLKMDMREMHEHHEKERQDLQDEIVRLRQLAGDKDDGVREILESRVQKALQCHNGALERVATLLGDDVPTKLHCRITFILENLNKLKDRYDELVKFLFRDVESAGIFLEIFQMLDCILSNAQEHDEMIRNFVDKLSDAQLNLQLALEDDVDFLSSSAMPTIMNPLNASTLLHDKTRLQQILTDKAESSLRNNNGVLPWNQNEERGEDGDEGTPTLAHHELSNVIEEDENKRGSSYLPLGKRSSSVVTRRTSIMHPPQNADEEPIRRGSRNSRRESRRLSSGPLSAMCRSPRVAQIQNDEVFTPANKTNSSQVDSPSSNDTSLNDLDRALFSPTLSVGEPSVTTFPTQEEIVPINLCASIHDDNAAGDSTSTEPDDMELTSTESTPAPPPPAAATGTIASDFTDAASLSNDSCDNSLITPNERRFSSFVRLTLTPPDEEGIRTSLPSQLSTIKNDVAGTAISFSVDAIPIDIHVMLPTDDESDREVERADEPEVKKMKTTSPAQERGSKKSKIAALENLTETSFNDFIPPAPPKPKIIRKKKKGTKTAPLRLPSPMPGAAAVATTTSAAVATTMLAAVATTMSAAVATTMSAAVATTMAAAVATTTAPAVVMTTGDSKSQKTSDVNLETYKKIIGQKSKPARSKSRKLSKSEENEIRAAAEVKAKAKPLEYAAFDASSRFGEGLSFLDETHVPSLTEFKQKQMVKQQLTSAPSSTKTITTATTAATTTTTTTTMKAPPTEVPDNITKTSSSKMSRSSSKSSIASISSKEADTVASSSTVSEDFLSSKPAAAAAPKRRKAVNYSDQQNDDDNDFVLENKNVKKRKPRGPSKTKAASGEKKGQMKTGQGQSNDDDIFFSPSEEAATDAFTTHATKVRTGSQSSVGSVEDSVVNGKGKRKTKKKRRSSLFFSCDDSVDEGTTTKDDVNVDRIKGTATGKNTAADGDIQKAKVNVDRIKGTATGKNTAADGDIQKAKVNAEARSKRGRVTKSYAEPTLNTKLRR